MKASLAFLAVALFAAAQARYIEDADKRFYDSPYDKRQLTYDSAYDKRIYDSAYDKRIYDSAYDKRIYDRAYDKRIYDSAYDKRVYDSANDKRIYDSAYEKRLLFPSVQPTISSQQYCYVGLPGLRPAYIVTEDGLVYYLINGQLILAQGYTTTGQVTTGQVTTGGTSSGGLLNLLARPLDAVGNIISKTGDVASGIVSLPFDAARNVVTGVGLGDTAIGNLATGIIDVGEGIEQTKLSLLTGAAELPFRLGANIAKAIEK